MESLLWAGADAQARALRAREVGAVELLDAVLARLAAVQPAINAFRVVCAEGAARNATAAQRRLDAGEDAPLLGVPIAIKDDTDLEGVTTCHGADPSVRAPATGDSEVVRRLRAAGAVIVGKTNVPELTIWPFSESVHHGATRNPWALDRTPGGSSGGSAAAVAAGVVGVALGSDGAGSIRIPASWCGLVGLKPTRDLVPIEPIANTWYRMVHFGPLARDVASAARFLDACARPAGNGRGGSGGGSNGGVNGGSGGGSNGGSGGGSGGGSNGGSGGGSGGHGYLAALDEPLQAPLRIAVSRHSPPGTLPALRRGEREAFDRAVALLSGAGHTLRELDPDVPLGAAEHVLARFLRGVHDSARAVPPGTRLERRTRGMSRIGRLVPAAALRASLRRESALAGRVLRVFDEVDVVLQPGPSTPPSRIGAYARAGALRTLGAAVAKVPFLPLWNLVGNPVLAAPVHLGADGLPAGVQLVGPPGGERTLLRLALQLERDSGWRDRRPPLS